MGNEEPFKASDYQYTEPLTAVGDRLRKAIKRRKTSTGSSVTDDQQNEENDFTILMEGVQALTQKCAKLDDIESYVDRRIDLRVNKESAAIRHEMNEKFSEILGYVNTIEKENKDLKSRLETLESNKNENDQIEESVCKNSFMVHEAMRQCNENEQYSRRNNIRINFLDQLCFDEEGKEDAKKTVCEAINKEYNMNLKPGHIAACHRLPRKK